MARFYVDRDLENADWVKKTWDLPTDADWWVRQSDEYMRTIVRLPVWRKAPSLVRRIVEDRLGEL